MNKNKKKIIHTNSNQMRKTKVNKWNINKMNQLAMIENSFTLKFLRVSKLLETILKNYCNKSKVEINIANHFLILIDRKNLHFNYKISLTLFPNA